MPRPLKFYGETASFAFYHDSARINAALGIGDWHRQLYVAVAARTKKDAVQFIQAAGGHATEREIRILTGNHVDAMGASGLLEEGAIYLSHGGRGQLLSVQAPKEYKVVGEFTQDSYGFTRGVALS